MNPLADYLARFDYAAIPLQRGVTGHLRLDGLINGVAASFCLDTGAGRTVLDLGEARRRGLELSEEGRAAGGLGTASTAAYRTTIGRLDLHAIEDLAVPVAVIDLAHVNASLRARGGAAMDGVIGADLLNAHEAIIDYKHLQLYLKRAARRAA